MSTQHTSGSGERTSGSGAGSGAGSQGPTGAASIREKVVKLLHQAADREGTPEGDTFREKAFALMAKYGVDASQLEENQTGKAKEAVFKFAGAYTDLQFYLLNCIAGALHCICVQQSLYRRKMVPEANVFGMAHHVERVDMLFSALNPIMIAGANRYAATLWPDAVHTRRAKRSWMLGFARTIADRLEIIEHEHSTQYARGSQSGELVLASDFNKAQAAAFERFPALERHVLNSTATIDPFAFVEGKDTGDMQDLGQKRMRQKQHAIGR